eukprot:441767-Rhodomonas_salina.2
MTRWLAPEVIRGARASEGADAWAFGVLMWELWAEFRLVPYASQTTEASVAAYVCAGGRLRSPAVCPAEVFGVMSECWDATANARPCFERLEVQVLDLLSHFGARGGVSIAAAAHA